MEMNKSWSIDDKRLNFQFGTEMAYEIKNGKMGRLLKNATYTGITPQFWGNCDAICNAEPLARVGHAQLRQGPARPGGPHRPRRRPGPLPQRPGRRDEVGGGETMLGQERIKEITDGILARSTADQTEVVILAGDSALTRFANSTIHQNVAETDTEVRIRVVLGTRVGVATTNNLDDEALAKALENALAIARLQPENPDFQVAARPAAHPRRRLPSARRRPAARPSSGPGARAPSA